MGEADEDERGRVAQEVAVLGVPVAEAEADLGRPLLLLSEAGAPDVQRGGRQQGVRALPPLQTPTTHAQGRIHR